MKPLSLRIARVVLALVSATLSLTLAGTVPAFANIGPGQTDCAHGGNPHATACENGRYGEVYYGAYDNFSDDAMSITKPSYSQGNHVNNEMWFYTHSDESQWVETGVRTGYWSTATNPCNCGYGHFWADFNPAGQEFVHPIGGFVASGNGSNHSYEVLRDAANHNDWIVYYDFNPVGTSTNQGSDTGYEIQAGLEDSDVTPSTSAANFNHSPLEYQDSNGALHDFFYQSTWVDDPCNGGNQGKCLNHLSPNHTTIWEDSKP